MKYLGSKSRIATTLASVMIPEGFNGRYIEPFVGGCGMMDKINCKNRIGVDSNPYLIAMWKCLQDDIFFPQKISRDLYNKQYEFYKKTRNNTLPCSLMELGFCGWIGFMESFNGKFFNGYSGHNSITKDSLKPRDYISENIRNTLSQVPKIKDVNFMIGDYGIVKPQKGDIIYCDPPYENTTEYRTSKKFNYNRFWNTMREWSSIDEVKVFISEYKAPNDFEAIWVGGGKNTMGLTSTKNVTEKLFIYKHGLQEIQ